MNFKYWLISFFQATLITADYVGQGTVEVRRNPKTGEKTSAAWDICEE